MLTQRGRWRAGRDSMARLTPRCRCNAKVLSLQPDRTDAIEGREDALADLLQQARGLLDAGKSRRSRDAHRRRRGYDAGHVDR